MKCAIFIFCILSCSLALPSRRLAWEDIKSENLYIDPITNYTAEQGIEGRVIGGSEISPHSSPYTVAIFINGRTFCGGSLISVNYVLTAAHCVTRDFSYLELVFGAHNVQTQEISQVVIRSAAVVVHPDYEIDTFVNDLALVRMPPLVININIHVIPLAPADAETYEDRTAFLTGWGKVDDDALSSISPVLRGVELRVISNAACARTYGNNIQQSVLCTSGDSVDGYVGGCHGDSGSPLVVDGFQIGLISFVSSRGCQAGLPTGFTRLSSHRQWIADNSDVILS